MKKWQWLLIGISGIAALILITSTGREFFMSLARNLISKWEGKKLTAYRDAVGKWTIGYGHLIKSGEKYYPYGPIKSITDEEAAALLENDLNDSRACVKAFVNVPLTDNQNAALISLIFNIGCENFRNSTLLKLINARKFVDASSQFDKWVLATEPNGNKVKLAGLVNRRADEKQLFNTA